MIKQKLILFDIDKTIIKTCLSHKKAFSLAFKKIYGVNLNVDDINPAGKTDWFIITQLLKKARVKKYCETDIKKIMELILKEFNKEIKNENIEVLSGVRKLLFELKKKKVFLGLVTGNIRKIAFKKMENIKLREYFKTGGFGSDHIKRSFLVELAVKRSRRYGFKGRKKDVWVVGDTHLDINAGKEAGVRTMGAATGHFSVTRLKQTGADAVLKDLRDTKRILNLFLN